jgi:N-acetyl-beta-hexosaminidase
LSRKDIKLLVEVCRQSHIRLIPQINLLGHQSWANQTGNLLRVYPEFDETPQVKMPEKYEWPNKDNLYCKSYCPLHPGVHKVVFDLIDELCDAFESDAFHAGMDEVFYIGHDSCKRCAGHDKAELYAGEVMRIRDHLKAKNRKLWIWGDRLIDGNTTGLGAWEASENGTYRAIDVISKDVIICDWHYDRPDQTPVYFAMKGFQVISCPWKKPQSADLQIQDMNRSRKYATVELKDRFQGIMQTVWTDAGSFLDEFYNQKSSDMESESACFKSIFPCK